MTKDDELHRIRISDETYDALKAASSITGHTYDTIVQLWREAGGEDSAQAQAAKAVLGMAAATQDEMKQGLSEVAPNQRIAMIRLKKRYASPSTAADGYTRTHAGADFTTSDPDLWLATRGFWVIGTRSNAIAAYRLGHFLGLYAGVTWSGKDHGNRRYAMTGYRVVDGKRVDPVSGLVLGPCSNEESAAVQRLSSSTLSMPNGASNPVANLFK